MGKMKEAIAAKKEKKPKKEKAPKKEKRAKGEKKPKKEKKVKEKKEGGGKKKLILILIIAIVLIILIAVGLFVFNKIKAGKEDDPAITDPATDPLIPVETIQKPFSSMELVIKFGFVSEKDNKVISYYDDILTKQVPIPTVSTPAETDDKSKKDEGATPEEVPAGEDAEPVVEENKGLPLTIVNFYSNKDFTIEYNNAFDLPWLRIGKGQYLKKFGNEFVVQINFITSTGKDLNVFYMIGERFTGVLSIKEWNKTSPHGKELYNPYKELDLLTYAEKLECADNARMFLYSMINWSGETLGISPMALGYLYHSNVNSPKNLNELISVKFELEENEFFGEKADVYVRRGYIKDNPSSHVALLFKDDKGCKVQMQVDGKINEFIITKEGAVSVTKSEVPQTAKQAYLMTKISDLTNLSPYTLANLTKFK